MYEYLIPVDVGKFKHWANVMTPDGEIVVPPFPFGNDIRGFKRFHDNVRPYLSKLHLMGMEDTGHYGNCLRLYALDNGIKTAMINPQSTDAMRKASLSTTKTDRQDTLLIGEVLCHPKLCRIVDKKDYENPEVLGLTRYKHNLEESCTVQKTKLQACIDLSFPEFNSLGITKYSKTYMRIIGELQSAEKIARTDIRTIRKCISPKHTAGKNASLTAEELKNAAKRSVGHSDSSLEMEIRHLVKLINAMEESIREAETKIEEYSRLLDSPILAIPGISHFSCVCICSEIRDINRFDSPRKLIKYAGVNPIVHESGAFAAKNTRISKKGSKYFRKILYQVIQPVINNNPVFGAYYRKKISEGKGHRCAQGHCIRKLLRVIYHILKTGEPFDPEKLR